MVNSNSLSNFSQKVSKTSLIFIFLFILVFLSLGSLDAVGTYPDVDTESMVLYYHFNNDSSVGESYTNVDDNIFDYSSGLNNGTTINTTWNLTGGYLNDGAFMFDGFQSNYSRINVTHSFNLTSIYSPFTVGMWFYSIDNKEQQLLDFANANSDTYAVNYIGSELTMGIYNGTNYLFKKSKSSVTKNNWHYFIYSYNLTDTYLYVDNILATTTTSGVSSNLGVNKYIIGARTASTNNVLNGSVDDLIVWNRSLNSIEMQVIYNKYINKDIYDGITIDNSFVLDGKIHNLTSPIIMGANNMVLDGNGSVIYFNTSAIYNAYNDTTIKNITLIQTGCSGINGYYGIRLNTGYNNIIDNNNISICSNQTSAIYAKLSHYNNITSNYIFMNTTTNYQILATYLDANSSGNSIRFNTMYSPNSPTVETDTYTETRGMHGDNGAFNNTISDNNITAFCEGIYASESSTRTESGYNFIERNNIFLYSSTHMGCFGIQIECDSNYNFIRNNTITALNNGGSGIFLFGLIEPFDLPNRVNWTLNNNIITGNNINMLNDSYGIFSYLADTAYDNSPNVKISNNLIDSNIILVNGSLSQGIRFANYGNNVSGNINNTVSNNNITVINGFSGVILDNSFSNQFSNNNIYTTSSSYGVYLSSNTTDNYFSNNNITVNSTATRVVYFYGDNIKNNTFNGGSINSLMSTAIGFAYSSNLLSNLFNNLNIYTTSNAVYSSVGDVDFTFNNVSFLNASAITLDNSAGEAIGKNINILNSSISLIQMGSNTSIQNLFFYNYPTGIRVNMSSINRANIYFYNSYFKVSNPNTTSSINYSINELSSSLIFNLTSGRICSGNCIETINPSNYRNFLDNFNLTEGISRQYSPIYFTSTSSTSKTINSSLINSVNTDAYINTRCDILGTITSGTQTYNRPSCTNNIAYLPALLITPGLNQLTINLNKASLDTQDDSISSLAKLISGFGMLGAIVIFILIIVIIKFSIGEGEGFNFNETTDLLLKIIVGILICILVVSTLVGIFA